MTTGVFAWRDELEAEFPNYCGEDGVFDEKVTHCGDVLGRYGELAFDRPPPSDLLFVYAGFKEFGAISLTNTSARAVDASTQSSSTEATTTEGLELKESRLREAKAALEPLVAELREISTLDSVPSQESIEKSTVEDRGRRLKRRVLIAEHTNRWPTVERDLKDAAENGLSAAARTDEFGWWWEGSAVAWARAFGKFEDPADTPWAGVQGTIHRLRR